MKVTVFTGNQPRHLALIRRLAAVSDSVWAVMECGTVFPGQVPDFYRKSEVMQRYFGHVIEAEARLFGGLAFLPAGVRALPIKAGDLNLLVPSQLEDALASDIYIVFGADYIKGWLAEHLVSRQAVNIHMGLSPYYRGSSCNFWALHDGRPGYVGATIHHLSRGLDSGPMLYHALPRLEDENPFEFTMRAVDAAQKSLVERISDGSLMSMEPQPQDRRAQLRYSVNAEFTDAVALEFLERGLGHGELRAALERDPRPELLHPYFG